MKKLKSLAIVFLMTCLLMTCVKHPEKENTKFVNYIQVVNNDTAQEVNYNYTNNADLIKLLDSSYNVKAFFDKSKKIDLLKGLSKGFENLFSDNYTFFLITDLSNEPLFFYPLLKKENLFVLKFENTGFLIIDRMTKKSIFFSFDIKQSIRKKIDLKYFLACHSLNKELLNKFSIIKKGDSMIIQRYFPNKENFLIEQGRLPKAILNINLFKDYSKLLKIESEIESKSYRKVREDISYFNYGKKPIFFLPTFNIPYEDPWE